MTIEPWYATREQDMSAADVKVANNPYQASQVDADISAASRTVDSLLHRRLYPWTGTRYFDFPARSPRGPSYKIWLEEFDLISPTEILNGDSTAISLSDVLLYPQSGPPYTAIELNIGTSTPFTAGSTWQRAIEVTGIWGDSDNAKSAGTIATSVSSSIITLEVSDSSLVGVGSLLKAGNERMHVSEKGLLTTGTTLAGDLDAKAATTLIPVASGSAVKLGEVISIDGEQMQVYYIQGNTLVVKRAVGGSVLATHTAGATVYAPRSLTVERGSAGTTAAAHSASDALTVWDPPAWANELTLAIANARRQQRIGGWTKANAEALETLMKQVREQRGRYRYGVA